MRSKRVVQTGFLPTVEILLNSERESGDADCEASGLGGRVPLALRSCLACASGWNHSRGRARRSI